MPSVGTGVTRALARQAQRALFQKPVQGSEVQYFTEMGSFAPRTSRNEGSVADGPTGLPDWDAHPLLTVHALPESGPVRR